MQNTCPICGYDDLYEPAYTLDCASYEICPCCDTEFGYNDQFLFVKEDCWVELRKMWIKDGMKWFSEFVEKPINWNPVSQLYKLSKSLEQKDNDSNYMKLIEKWAKEFEENRYYPPQAEIDAMNSDLIIDLLNHENKSD